MQYIGLWVPNIRSFYSTISRFQYIAHYTIFALTHMLLFAKKSNTGSLYSTMVANVVIKFS